jgi:hypothetical protein
MTTQQAVPMRYLHQSYFGRPSCPKCGQLMMAPEQPEFSEGLSRVEIRHYWLCDGCDNRFDTVVEFQSVAA